MNYLKIATNIRNFKQDNNAAEAGLIDVTMSTQLLQMSVAGMYNSVTGMLNNHSHSAEAKTQVFYKTLKDVSTALDRDMEDYMGIDRILHYRSVVRQDELLQEYIDAVCDIHGVENLTLRFENFELLRSEELPQIAAELNVLSRMNKLEIRIDALPPHASDDLAISNAIAKIKSITDLMHAS